MSIFHSQLPTIHYENLSSFSQEFSDFDIYTTTDWLDQLVKPIKISVSSKIYNYSKNALNILAHSPDF